MRRKLYKLCLSAVFAMLISVPLMATNLSDAFLNHVNNIAREKSVSETTLTDSGLESAVYAHELQSLNELSRFTAKHINTPEDVQEALRTLSNFGYRVRTEADKFAFFAALSSIEEKSKFIGVQSGSPETVANLEAVISLTRDDFNSSLSHIKSPSLSAREAFATIKSRPAQETVSSPVSRSSAAPMPGAHVKNGKTTFTVYAPAATKLELHLFAKPADKKGTVIPMKKNSAGYWSVTLPKVLYGVYYGYKADGPKGNGHLFDPDRLLSDPYAFANYNHDGKSIVVDRSYNWKVKNFKAPLPKDAIIYEMHIKDFTAHSSSGVKGPDKGKYLGLLHGKGTDKVLGHLKDLGVNTIELMPVHEFDNNFAGVTNHWGYMTSHFFAPESSYASGKEGQGVKELKALIDGLHQEGFAVILDVVYNHTAEGNHEGLPLNFKGLNNPGYYRLMPDNPKFYWNGTGCGNEMKTEDPATSQMIIDSLKYWMNEYKVDGFRFDLGTIIDKKTMTRIINELPKNTILTAEPWAADWNRNQWAKSDFRNTNLSKWNDDFREKIRAMANGNTSRNDVMTVLAGSCFWWAAKPDESLNYVEAHDGYTLFDLYKGDQRKTRFAAIALLTAQGIPMIHAGQEFDRTKKGNHNSYDQDNEINYINWNEKNKNRETFELYKGLIALRKKYPNFRYGRALNKNDLDWILPQNNNGIGMILKGQTTFVVLFNGDQKEHIKFDLPMPGKWKVVSDGLRIQESGLYTAEGNYVVPPVRAVILAK